ncbi:MAG: PilT/PilU family type 4a pilus ATPase [Eubacteriales bacterium]|nr:PilT/PilU family type 4a pilus ATPase [Eubacteriales bacterium]
MSEPNRDIPDIRAILKEAVQTKSSDVFVVPGAPLTLKTDGLIVPSNGPSLMPDETFLLVRQIYDMAGRGMETLTETGDDDFSLSMAQLGRFRCNAYKQRNSYAVVLRVMSFDIPAPEQFHIPPEIMQLASFRKGLVLVTGAAGSGKSTTLACLIDRINSERQTHIITIEDPIEFIYKHKKSIVSQREVAHDTMDYKTALRAALRQAPGVILVGEMRDYETIHTALTAAETGQLVLATLHTMGAAKTIDRIIDIFPANQQQQIRIQLSMLLRATVSQQLLPTLANDLYPAFEILVANSAVQNMIRESKTHQLDNVMASGTSQGMRTMDGDIARLFAEGRISRKTALLYAVYPDMLSRRL